MKQLPKYVVMIFFLTAYALPVKAQAVLALLFGKKIHNDKLSLGIHLGLESSGLSNTPGSERLAGLALGAYTNIQLKGKWMLSNYFIFKSPRGASAVPQAYQLQSNVAIAADADLKRKLTYMEISPLLRYNITHGFSIAAGPQIAIRTVAKDIYKLILPDGGKETITYNTKDSYGLFDIDAAADIQYAFGGGRGLRLNLRLSQGFTNIYKEEVPLDAKNRYFQIGVGIPIAIGSSSPK